MTARKCLSFSLPWKPTRQVRGCVVYDSKKIAELDGLLAKKLRTKTTSGVPQAVRRQLGAQPSALFSIKQTWETKDPDDYSLQKLIDEAPLLAANQHWRLTPNSGEVSAAIAAESARSGVKTLVFFQSIKNALSAARKITKRLANEPVKLTSEENESLHAVCDELGDTSHTFMDFLDGTLRDNALVHHGLLLREERHLCESLFQRSDGVAVLTATSTLAQGMNLPSELVLIAEDSRYVPDQGRATLEAQELLNAAGRAGRAGKNSTGMVLVIPGNIVSVDLESSSISGHWMRLQEIFGQSDQCLEIDDPLCAILDRIESEQGNSGSLERYCVGRMSGGDSGQGSSELVKAIGRTLSSFRARRDGDEEWIKTRTSAAVSALEDGDEEDSVEKRVASVTGVSISALRSLTNFMATRPMPEEASPGVLVDWMFDWMSSDASVLSLLFRDASLRDLFGKPYGDLPDDESRVHFVLPRLRKYLLLWMNGATLAIIEESTGTPADSLKHCMTARKFVLRFVPELSHIFGLPGQIVALRDETEARRLELRLLHACVRNGFIELGQIALRSTLPEKHRHRTAVQSQFARIRHLLPEIASPASWADVEAQVATAVRLDADNGEEPPLRAEL